MDLICLILAIIDIFKPFLALSIATIVCGVIETLLLVSRKKDSVLPYVCGLGAIIIGVVKICMM